MNKLLLGLIFTILLCASCTNRGMVAIDNGIVKLEFDLKQGTYKGIDVETGQTCIYDASWRVNDFLSTDADSKRQFRILWEKVNLYRLFQ